MWWRLLTKSLLHRRSRIGVMAAALMLSSMLISAFLILGAGVERKAAGELKAYGPNLLLVPEGFDLALALGGLSLGSVARTERLPLKTLDTLGSVKEVEGVAPFLYGIGEVNGKPVVIAGSPLPTLRRLFPGWRWQGEPQDLTAVYPGIQVATALGLKSGETLYLQARGGQFELRVGGVVDVGGSEDRQLLVDMALAERLLGEQGLDLAFLRAQGSPKQIAQVAEQLEELIPGSRVKVLSQVTEAEAKVLSRIRYLMGLVAILVTLAAALAVFSTMTFSVWERRREVGLMKALGAWETRVMLHFLAEAWGIAWVSGLAGSLLGIGLARWIALRVFASPVELPPLALPLTWVIIVGVTTMAAYLPVRRAAAIAPAVVLKGE